MSATETADTAAEETAAEAAGPEDTGSGEQLSDLDKAAATLASLLPTGAAAAAEDAGRPDEPKLDAQGRAYATGKRKDAVARVWVKPGAGRINGQRPRSREPISPAPALQHDPERQPLRGCRACQRSVRCRHGHRFRWWPLRPGRRRAPWYLQGTNLLSSRACGGVLKKGGFLTRDSRVVERKKYGKAKARRSFQFSKR